MSLSLTRRLQSLYDNYKSTLALIQQLSTFSPSLPDNDRLDLASQIHDSLKDQEDTLALLRQELDDDTPPSSRHRRQSNGALDSERERNADIVARLTEDLRTARGKFRRAQLQAKNLADDAKRKEREALFRRKDVVDGDGNVRPASRIGQRGGGQEKSLTQDEIARNASEDVTRALRRAHDLLSANLSQSQFAQQTLDESQDALKGLGESYGGTGDLLKASKGLVGQLVRSNKSDSWYLQTAFYMMVVTLAWLVFRRWLYGPLWWLVFLPLKLGYKGAALLIGGGPIVSSTMAVSSSVRMSMVGVPTNPSGMMFKSMGLPAKGGGWGDSARPPNEGKEDIEETMVEKVGKMMDEAQEGTIHVDDLIEEERSEQEEKPRNTKKRMMEVEVESERKDEL